MGFALCVKCMLEPVALCDDPQNATPALADLGGAREVCPLGPNIFYFDAVCGKIWSNSRLAPP